MSDHDERPSPSLRYTIDDNLALLRMDDGKVNALRDELLEPLEQALDAVEHDDEVKAVILTGREGQFSAGFDIRHLPTLDLEARLHTVTWFGRLAERLYTFPKPLITAVSGHALAGGAILAMCGDRRIGTRGGFKLGLTEVAIGLWLPRFVIEMARGCMAPRDAYEACIEARVYTPSQAVEVGLLHQAVDLDELVERARAEAHRLAELDPRAFAHTKRRLRNIEGFAIQQEDFRELIELTAFAGS